MAASPPFSVVAPVGPETPLVVEVPHAGLELPPHCLPPVVAPARALGRDADLFVDALYAGAPAAGATLLVAHVSRYVIDLNRAEGDVDAETVQGARSGTRLAHGLIWRLTTEGERALARPLSPGELAHRLETIYRPYHTALEGLLEAKRARFGFAVLLAAHSMPSVARAGHVDTGAVRADVVPGSRGRTSAHASVIDLVESQARAEGLSVAHDEPYKGGFSTMFYGRPHEGLHAIQVELARRLYMDESRLEPLRGGFGRTQSFCEGLMRRLGALTAADLR